MRIDRRSALKLLTAPALIANLRALPSNAEQYPAKPIRIIVPYPAGGPYDGIPRIVAQQISAQVGCTERTAYRVLKRVKEMLEDMRVEADR